MTYEVQRNTPETEAYFYWFWNKHLIKLYLSIWFEGVVEGVDKSKLRCYLLINILNVT